MADPATLGILGAIGSVGQTIFGAIGGQQQAQSQAQAANYQAAVARNNQKIAEDNARYAAQAGAVQAQAQDMKNRQVAGAILAGQGASGIDVDSESSKQVRESQAQLGRLDTATIYQRALLQSRDYEAQATNFGAEAQLDTLRAQSAERAGSTAVFGSLLGGATSFSDKWLKFQTTGVGSTSTGGLF